jgi:hypothetical protein
LPPVGDVIVFNLLDLLLEILVVLRYINFFLLARDDFIGIFEDGLHFFLMTMAETRLEQIVLLVFIMQLEDNLGELGYLLRHLVMCLL